MKIFFLSLATILERNHRLVPHATSNRRGIFRVMPVNDRWHEYHIDNPLESIDVYLPTVIFHETLVEFFTKYWPLKNCLEASLFEFNREIESRMDDGSDLTRPQITIYPQHLLTLMHDRTARDLRFE
jgi:hypothetical protein